MTCLRRSLTRTAAVRLRGPIKGPSAALRAAVSAAVSTSAAAVRRPQSAAVGETHRNLNIQQTNSHRNTTMIETWPAP
jgi:hypothetical protein